MHGRKHCTPCGGQANRLNVKTFVITPKVLIVATNRCHNGLRGQLTRTCLDITQVLDTGMYIAGNHKNVTPISNYVLSGTIHHIGSSRKHGPYVTYIFADSGSTVTLINGTKIQSFDFSTLSLSEGFNNFQRNSHILFYIRTDHINTSTVAPSNPGKTPNVRKILIFRCKSREWFIF